MKRFLAIFFLAIVCFAFWGKTVYAFTPDEMQDIHDIGKDKEESSDNEKDKEESSGNEIGKEEIEKCTGGRFHVAWYSRPRNATLLLENSNTQDIECLNDGDYVYLVEGKKQTNGYRIYYVCGKGKANIKLSTLTQRYDSDWGSIKDETNSDEYEVYLYSFFTSDSWTSIFSCNEDSDDFLNPLWDINIPIFSEEDEEAIKNFEETGDTSGAQNSDHFKDYYNEAVPMPHDFKVLQGVDQSISGSDLEYLTVFNHDIVVTWSQDDIFDNMQFEIEGAFSAKRMSDSDYTSIKEHTGSWKSIVSKTGYGGNKSMTVQISKSDLNARKEKGYLTKLVLRVRNVVGNQTSNWCEVTVDLKNKTATATESGYEDNSDTGNNEYNNTDVNSDPNTSNINTDNVSFSGILGFIKSGFGLLGSGGIIALMSKTFLFLPGSVWTIINFFISMLVVICVIKAIKEVLF